MAKYVLSIFSDENSWAKFSQEDVAQAMKAWNAFTDETKASGAFIAGEGLAPTSTAKTVSMQGTKRSTTDGPYAETKEILFSYYIVDVPDLDAAIGWARKMPATEYGSIEIRPLV